MSLADDLARTRPASPFEAQRTDTGPTSDAPVIAVIQRDNHQGGSVAARVRRIEPAARLVVVPPDDRARCLIQEDCDVLLVDVTEGAAAIGFAISVVATNRSIHPVFVTDARFRPEAEALRGLGLKYVVAEADLWEWLREALGPLSRLARAIRELSAAEQAVPATPDGTASAPPGISLPLAEQRFRETYLRCVMSQSRSQKAAATMAGVPYTTLRSMLEKLVL